jgi:hypothetical protein
VAGTLRCRECGHREDRTRSDPRLVSSIASCARVHLALERVEVGVAGRVEVGIAGVELVRRLCVTCGLDYNRAPTIGRLGPHPLEARAMARKRARPTSERRAARGNSTPPAEEAVPQSCSRSRRATSPSHPDPLLRLLPSGAHPPRARQGRTRPQAGRAPLRKNRAATGSRRAAPPLHPPSRVVQLPRSSVPLKVRDRSTVACRSAYPSRIRRASMHGRRSEDFSRPVSGAAGAEVHQS